MNNYIELHLHTTYTKGNSTLTIEEAVERAKEYGMTSLGIMDSASLEGVDEFVECCKNASINPVIGSGFYLSLDDYKKSSSEKYHLPIIAKDRIGLSNLNRLDEISHSISSLVRPQIDIDLLKKYNEGLIVLTGGRGGPVDKLIKAGNREEAVTLLERLKALFKDNIYIEIQDNGRVGESRANTVLSNLSKDLEIEMVATGGPFYLNSSDAQKCNELRNSSGNRILDGKGFFFSSSKDQLNKFKSFKNAIRNTGIISNSTVY